MKKVLLIIAGLIISLAISIIPGQARASEYLLGGEIDNISGGKIEVQCFDGSWGHYIYQYSTNPNRWYSYQVCKRGAMAFRVPSGRRYVRDGGNYGWTYPDRKYSIFKGHVVESRACWGNRCANSSRKYVPRP